MHGRITGQQLSPWELPDFAQDAISNDLEMRQGIKAIEGLVRNCKPGEVVKLSPYMSQQLVQYMNARQQWSGHIERIYWGVSPTALESIADQVRRCRSRGGVGATLQASKRP